MTNSAIVRNPVFGIKRQDVLDKPIVQYGLSFQRVVESSSVIVSANSFLIKNSGTSTFEINRSVTLGPGERLEFATDSYNELYVEKMNIDFISAGTNLCEIIKVTANISEVDNYTGKAVT